ncbi:MAG: hypothetical protein Q8909_16570 [Bacteroidota bacterium]|nr:hypothetical protein [Bacteroidota bacterium]
MKTALHDPSRSILKGKRLHQLEEYQARYILQVIGSVSEKVVPLIAEDMFSSDQQFGKRDMVLRAFTFYFDKTIEMVYNMRVGNDKGIDFNLAELFQGISGDNIPEYIQLKVNKIIPTIALLCNTITDYVRDMEYSDFALEEKIKTILYSSVQIAIEYTLRIDLDDDTEIQHYLENC